MGEVHRSAVLLVSVALALTAGCGGDDEGHEWTGPPTPSSGGRLAVAGWNEHVEQSGERVGRSPVASADMFLRLDRRQASTVSVVVRRGAEAGDEANVTVLIDGLLDDSVRSERNVLEFVLGADGIWRLLSARRAAQRCHTGRGHQGFSPRPCV